MLLEKLCSFKAAFTIARAPFQEKNVFLLSTSFVIESGTTLVMESYSVELEVNQTMALWRFFIFVDKKRC